MPTDSSRLILVTGGTGYVGSVLVPELAKQYRVRTYDSQLFGNSIGNIPGIESVQGDIRDPHALNAALKGVSDVIHLAGIVTDELVDQNPERAREVNCDALMRLLTLCYAHQVERFILMSSSSVYGLTRNGKETDKPEALTEYARQKLTQETLVNANASLMSTTIVRSATLCGPAPRMRLDTIVNAFCKQAWFDQRVTVWGGQQLRTNVHVADLTGFYCWLLPQDLTCLSGEIFNVTSGNHSAAMLGRMVASIHGSATVTIDAAKTDSRSYSMSAEKAHRWGWQSSFSIEQAIKDNFAWFAAGKIDNPNDDIHYNNRRMAPLMRA